MGKLSETKLGNIAKLITIISLLSAGGGVIIQNVILFLDKSYYESYLISSNLPTVIYEPSRIFWSELFIMCFFYCAMNICVLSFSNTSKMDLSIFFIIQFGSILFLYRLLKHFFVSSSIWGILFLGLLLIAMPFLLVLISHSDKANRIFFIGILVASVFLILIYSQGAAMRAGQALAEMPTDRTVIYENTVYSLTYETEDMYFIQPLDDSGELDNTNYLAIKKESVVVYFVENDSE